MRKTKEQIIESINGKVTFSVKAEPNGFPIQPFFSTEIEADYNVIVTAHYKDLKGYSYLTGCNYNNQEQFEMGMYYKEMQEEALDALVIEIIAVVEQVAEFV